MRLACAGHRCRSFLQASACGWKVRCWRCTIPCTLILFSGLRLFRARYRACRGFRVLGELAWFRCGAGGLKSSHLASRWQGGALDVLACGRTRGGSLIYLFWNFKRRVFAQFRSDIPPNRCGGVPWYMYVQQREITLPGTGFPPGWVGGYSCMLVGRCWLLVAGRVQSRRR